MLSATWNKIKTIIQSKTIIDADKGYLRTILYIIISALKIWGMVNNGYWLVQSKTDRELEKFIITGCY